MVDDLGYGSRLSDEEYDQCVIELQAHLPPMPSREQEQHVQHQELELAINHRLGIDFPELRRDMLWLIKQRVERKRVRLIAKYALRNLFGRSTIPKGLSDNAHGIAGFMVDAFAEVLNEKELLSFFGLKKDERPSLPLQD